VEEKMNKPLGWLLASMITIVLSPRLGWADDMPDSSKASVVTDAGLQELLQWADAHNPDLAVMNYEIEAAEGRIVPAGALPDPVLRVELMDFAGPAAPNGFSVLPNRVGGTKYTVMQSFPLWGKRDMRTEIATAGVSEAKSRRIALLAEIHSKIKTAYAQFYQPFQLKRLNEEILALLQDIEAITRTRYSNGLVPQQDVIRAQVEKTTLRSEIITLEAEQKQARARLNVMVGRPQHTPVTEPQALRRIASTKFDATALQEKAQRNNPLLRTQDAQITAAEATRRLVEKNRYPDVTLGIAPTQRGGGIDGWEAMVEVNIPIRFDTRRAQESEASAMLGAAKERQQSIANNVMGELQETIAAYEAAREQELLVTNTLLPQAELTFRSALAGYENSKVDFATLLDAQRAIRLARQDKIRAQVVQEIRLAEIERIIGEEL
jgi:outer membrane protein, heavy metal efflux system